MSRAQYLLAVSITTLLVSSVPVFGQRSAPARGHVIVIKLVTKAGSVPYAFEPANITARNGDTLRFVEGAGPMHNVHFKSHPAGAKLGAATVGPYLTAKGQTYDVVIDARFTSGKYEFVCDPHEALGMVGTLTVGSNAALNKSKK